ncbi:hypothetical protein V8J88_18285 [Massilia sp. W12]|uniref:hypothetical protein n=1 Tax=Massilia sp. W12 TaxID=3126507 RepID=UPI0030CC53C3
MIPPALFNLDQYSSEIAMTDLPLDIHARFNQAQNRPPLQCRIGRRTLSLRRDYRKRFYSVNPLLDCGAGFERGHLEILLLGRWLLELGRAD